MAAATSAVGILDGVMLLGVVLRALGVALLSATVLVPVADHHAAARLPDAGIAHPPTVYELLAHHHPDASARTHRADADTLDVMDETLPALPTVMPSAPVLGGELSLESTALAPFDGLSYLAPLGWMRPDPPRIPRAIARPPPEPPPLPIA